ncbi:wax ester synthase/diacylglycerol acyltransferase 4-like [Trifolium pratense]|uniref:wax ester synthase/diacylglycerol acyltransferase 4-like n=1 Tax=Trifolium pratense TaxID=57577 RepID=UPI001E693A66|nr:wax ester synthase/diacylglycerol acyltransferase 4-like [Trifolium pratense]
MDKVYEEFEEPVSPHGQYFNSSVICSYVFVFMEFAIPIDDLQIIPFLKDIFIHINPRFSSIMVRDIYGKMTWQKVEVNVEEHVKIPKFPEITTNASSSSSNELYDNYVSDYVTSILSSRTPQDKPLREIHLIKYPTTNAGGTLIFQIHHALGDGYSLMSALLSCLQRADDPSLPLSFPSRRKTKLDSKYANKSLFKKLCLNIFSFFSSLSDFGSTIIKTRLIEDDKTPIRSGYEGTESQPFTLLNISLSLDQIKEIKSKLRVTINDVVCGMIFYGIRLYMEEMNEKTKTSNSTAVVMLNTRNVGYQSLKEMQKPESKGLWGNQVSFLHIPIPKLINQSYPLQFVWETRKLIQRKRHSFGVHLIGLLMDLEMKLRGPEAVAKIIYNTLGRSSVNISNMVGPIESMSLENHPVNGFYFAGTGGSENVNITIVSYVKILKISLRTLKGFIDEKKFKFCIEKAVEVIFKAAMEVSEITNKN